MRRRLRRAQLALALVLLVALQVPLVVLYSRSEHIQLAGRTVNAAEVVADAAGRHLGHASTGALSRIARFEHERTGGIVAVFDADAELVVVAGDQPVGVAPVVRNHPDVVAALEGRRVSSAVSYERHPGWISVAVPAHDGGRIVGAVDIAVPTHRLDQRVQSLVVALSAFSAAVLMIVMVYGDRLTGWVLRPLEDLASTAASWAEGNLGARARIDAAPPEVVRLGATCDAMAARLERVMAVQRSFAADASHELRIPLTVQRLQLENLADHLVPEGLPLLDDLLEGSDTFCRRLDGLLLLANAESSPVPVQPVDVVQAVQRCVRWWTPQAARLGLTLVSVLPEDRTPSTGWARRECIALELPGATGQILDNLMSNACKASPPGGVVTIAVQLRADTVRLRVEDQGPGPEVLDRFPSGRSSVGYAKGSGLGLAIVTRLVAAMQGALRFDQVPGGGLRVCVDLPADRRSDVEATSPDHNGSDRPSREGVQPTAGSAAMAQA